MARPQQPLGPLGSITCVSGQSFAVSGTSGQIRPGGEQGFFVVDTRMLNQLVLTIDGEEPDPLRSYVTGGDTARFGAFVADDSGPDPKLVVDRRRRVGVGLLEEFRLRNYATEPRTLTVELQVGTDFAYIFDVRHGRRLPPARSEPTPDGVRLFADDGLFEARVRTKPAPQRCEGTSLLWQVTIPAHGTWELDVEVRGDPTPPAGHIADEMPVLRPPSQPPWSAPSVTCSDERFELLLQRSLDDLESLLVVDPIAPGDRFFAAGSPWYLTLFGRDSLWSARMALPLGPRIAGETLRVLARRQGTRRDLETDEAPGKILHEIRRGALVARGDLPPVYYGTMDATPLFVTLAVEAWRWGLPEHEVEQLVPSVERALQWMREDGDPDGDGFLEYIKGGRRGLVNQGWKDSVDGIQFADGRLAEAPIALCEVQGYAYEAAVGGADLIEHFGRPGADAWRTWARDLRRRFRAAFWVDDPEDPYPAIALDRNKQRVDAVASNMGHLPSTGLLDEEECALVARRLARRDMDSGWGVRTMAASSARFNPFSYHGGSVWPHDSAIVAANLAASGHPGPANSLLHGLVAAGRAFGFRLPELYAGEQRTSHSLPLPYPAACQPQAWAAAGAWLLLRAVLGLEPDFPAQRLRLRPLWPPPFELLSVRDLKLGGETLDITISRREGVVLDRVPSRLRVEVTGAPVIDQIAAAS